MDNHKVMAFGAALILALASCSEASDQTVSKSKYDALVQECNQLKQMREETMEVSEQNAQMINGIFSELRSLSGRTSELHYNVENNVGGNRKKAEEIAEDLKLLKQRLADIPKEATAKDKQMQSVINNLRSAIEQQEQEINRLTEIIKQKDAQLAEMGENLARTNTNLHETSEKLQQTSNELNKVQRRQWISIGDQLIEAAELLPDVKGHGNMKNVKQARLAIIKNAINCYTQAEELGEPGASAKLKSARAFYNRAESR